MDQTTTNTSFFSNKLTLGHFLTWRFVVPVLLVLAAIGGWFAAPLFVAESNDEEKDEQQNLIFVKTMTLEKLDEIRIPIWYSGEVRARQRTMVGFQRAGKVEAINFDEGDFVQADAELAQLDRRQVAARLDQLKAQKDSAKAVLEEVEAGARSEVKDAAKANVTDLERQLENARADLSRAEKLHGRGAIAKSEYDRIRFTEQSLVQKTNAAKARLEELNAGIRQEKIKAADANFRAMEAAVDLAQHDLDDCTLKAPFAGTIVRRMVDMGAVLDTGTPVFELIESQELELHVGVPAEIAARLQLGDEVELSSAPMPKPEMPSKMLDDDCEGEEQDCETRSQPIKGKVKAKIQSLDARTRTQKIIIKLDPQQGNPQFFDSQVARVRFEKVSNQEGFKIPVTAIENDQRGLWSCFTIEKTETGETIVKRQSLNVQHFQGDWVYAKGSISDGQQIVLDGLQRITNGQQVELTSANSEGQ